MAPFVFLWVLNVMVVGAVLWRRTIYSAEGYALGYVLVSVLVDGIQLLFVSATAPETLLTQREFELRLYPTVIHILGIVVFAVGLEAGDFRAEPVVRPLSDADRSKIGAIAVALIVTGAVLYLGAILLSGTGFSLNFVPDIDQLRSTSTTYGGFWYRGAGVVLFGVALLIARKGVGLGKALIILAVNAVLAMFCVGGKGSIASVVVFMYFLSAILNRELFRTLMRPAIVVTLLVLMYFGTGVKATIASRGLSDISTSISEISDSGQGAVRGRYSHEGLYRRYASMIEYLNLNGFSHFEGFRVGVHSATSWVPRLLYPNKPDHPFRGIDFMMNPEGITEMPDGNDATTLVGWGYVDAGVWTLVPYLFIGGAIVGLLRRLGVRRNAPIHWRVGYLFVVLGGAVSSEAGLLGLVDATLFAVALMFVAQVAIWTFSSASQVHRGRSVHPAPSVGAPQDTLRFDQG
jgi:hypothetical protein